MCRYLPILCDQLKHIRMETFFCGLSVRSGCIIIALFQYIFAIWSIVSGIEAGISSHRLARLSQIIAGVLSSVTIILLLQAVIKCNRYLLVPWLIVNGLANLALLGLSLFLVYLLIKTGFLVIVSVITGIIITTFISFYFYVCVLSFYWTIEEDEAEEEENQRAAQSDNQTV